MENIRPASLKSHQSVSPKDLEHGATTIDWNNSKNQYDTETRLFTCLTCFEKISSAAH